MIQQIDQLEVFKKLVKAMDTGKYAQTVKADKIIRKALSENKKRDLRRSTFSFEPEEMVFFNSLQI